MGRVLQVGVWGMNELFYAIYSPSTNLWLDENGCYGEIAMAEHFDRPEPTRQLQNDQRWVGPIADGEYK